jgi:hypothetical protein
MPLTLLQKIALGISGITAFSIGAFIVVAPHAFYASYGVLLGNDADLLSELRAPGAGLAGFGAIMIAGILRSEFTQVSIVVALTVFLGFPAGRVVGLLADGMPSSSIVGALIVELLIAALCLVAFRKWVWSHSTRDNNKAFQPDIDRLKSKHWFGPTGPVQR